MNFYEAAIAATALARGDRVLTTDADYDRIRGLKVVKP
jgi:predicted nucleic acid-binding protein